MAEKEVWVAIAACDEVGNYLLACEAEERRLVVFRRRDDQIAALDDECWHKLLPLSNGQLANDEVTCAYHGLVFGSDGRCVRSRLGPAPATAHVRPYVTAEAAGLVWVRVPCDRDVDETLAIDIGAMRLSLPAE